MRSQHSFGHNRRQWPQRLSAAFERNDGQTVSEVSFLARFRGYKAYLTPAGVTICCSSPKAGPVVSLRFHGASATQGWEGTRRLKGVANYFLGSDPALWRRNIPTFGELRCPGVWPGTTVVCHGSCEGQLEIDFIVEPGADPNCIRLGLDGTEHLELTGSGDLILHAGQEHVCLCRPVIYQEDEGGRTVVEGGYAIKENGWIAFTARGYDKQRALVIDPVLVYSTYLGGSAGDSGHAIAVDATGHAYVAGRTESLNFPTDSAFQAAHGGGSTDAFVTKLNPAGDELVYSTYIGGRGWDVCRAIALDADGNAYLAGHTTSRNFPVQDAFQEDLAGPTNAFVTKLNAAGNDLVYSTYLGGTVSDLAHAIAVDGSRAVYVTGVTASADFHTVSPVQAELAGGNDCFVTKLAPDGQSLVFSTFIGGSSDDRGDSIAVDDEGAVYVGGYTESPNLQVTANVAQPVFGGGTSDAFVAKLTSTGDAYEYLTYLGGSGSEAADGGCHIAVDGTQVIVVTSTFSDDFPTVSPLQSTRAGDRDVAVAKLSADGASLVFSTYLGGPLEEQAHGVAIDGYGNIVVSGFAHAGFPTLNAIQEEVTGAGDAFVSILTGDGSMLLFSTFLGGSQSDVCTGPALDPQGRIYVAGQTPSGDFPTTTSGFQRAFAGGSSDAFVVKLTGRPAYPYEYAALVVSGIQDDPGSRRLARGAYATTVNIHNPNSETVTFFKKLALTYPPPEQLPGEIFPIATDRLGPDETLKSDGDDIALRLFPGGMPAPVIQGFLVVQCKQPLDVTAVYTTGQLDDTGQITNHSSMHVEQVRERVRNADVSIEKTAVVAGRLEAEPGVFLAAVLYSLKATNHGPFLAEELMITDLLRAENSLCYVFGEIEPIVEPPGLFTINYQTYVESEISIIIPQLPVGATAEVSFWVLALYTNLLGVARLINGATAFHALFDPNPQNNSKQVVTQLWP